MSQTTVIRNARLVNEDRVFVSDVLLANGRIARIESEISTPVGASVCDANGRHLLPGMIDDQVHFREPGLTHKGNIYSESRAAIAGGVTSYMDMPNNKPPVTSIDHLEWKYARAADTSAANYGFLLRRQQRQYRGYPGTGPGADLWRKSFHGRVHRQYAGR